VTFAAANEAEEAAPPPAGPDAATRRAVWWHAGWALALAMAALAAVAVAPWRDANPGMALIAAVAPAIAALFLLRGEGGGTRIGLLVIWTAAAVIAAGLTGGVTGPLAIWCLAPLAAAILFGRRSVAWGGAFSVGALAVAGLAEAAGLTPAPPAGALAATLAVAGVATMAAGLTAAIALARVAAAETAAPAGDDRLARLAASQPHLIVAMDVEGVVDTVLGGLDGGLAARVHAQGLAGIAAASARADVDAALDAARREGRASLVFPLDEPEGAWLGLDLAWLDGGRLVGALRDATADHEREAALEKARADAEALNQGKSRFLANMSHELRTPLNAIMGFADIMRQRIFGPLPGKYVEYADLIHDAGAHLLDLINDVLDMAKIEAAKYELALEHLDAREPVQAALRLMRVQADDVGVQLRGLLPAEPLDAEVDRRALKQIVLNLVSNALKFTPRGGLVTVSLMALDGAMELSVADNGVGIAEHDLARLGRPYEQAGDADQQARGTGLGLSLVRAFAELHGGEMAIESRLGEGTAINVRLPVLTGSNGENGSSPHGGGGEVIAFNPQR